MRPHVLLAALLVFCSCSDDSNPPPGDAGGDRGPGGDGRADHQIDKGFPWDGFDPKCPMGPPCVYESKGEGKHAEDVVVIGETITLSGKELAGVDTVWIGGAEAPILSTSAAQVTCRVGPRTPGGKQSVEVKSGTRRRIVSGPTVRRLVAVAAADHTKLITFDAATHSTGAALDLPEPAAAAPKATATGRYVVVQGATKLVVVDLAVESNGAVSGLTGETVSSWTTDGDDKHLFLATASGKLFVVELASLASLAAKQAATAPATVSVQGWGGKQLAGLHPSVASGEGSIWYAASDLKTSSWVQQGSKPLVLGSGASLKAVASGAADGTVAFLAQDGTSTQLALLSASSTALQGEGAFAAAGFALTIAAGGGQVALSADGASPTLAYAATKGSAATTPLALGGSGATRVVALRLPATAAAVAALVGPKPSTGAFIASGIELADLAKGTRLAASGKPALELGDLRGAVGDPIGELLHVVTGAAYRAFTYTIASGSATTAEKHPAMTLPAGKDYRWILVQP